MRLASIRFGASISADDELTHDGCDGALGGFSGGDELLISGIEFGVVTGGDKGGPKSACLTPASAADVAFAFPLAGLSRDPCEACEGRGLLVLEPAEFELGCSELIAGPRPAQNTIPFDA